MPPVGRGEPGQFATLTAGEDEVALGAGPLRAIAVRPQVALPAGGALVAAAGLTVAHLAYRSPAASRHGRDTPAGGHMPAQEGRGAGYLQVSAKSGRIGVSRASAV